MLIKSLCCMKRAHYSKRMLFVQHMLAVMRGCANRIALSFVGVLHDRVFENNFADFSAVVQVKKKSRFCPAVGGVSNQQHLLFWPLSKNTVSANIRYSRYYLFTSFEVSEKAIDRQLTLFKQMLIADDSP